MKKDIVKHTLQNSKNGDETASKANPRLINPALRHAPHLDYAIEGATLLFQIPKDEIRFIDALDLAIWLSKSSEKKNSKAGIFWGAIQWFASEHPTAKGPDRDKKAIELLDLIKKELPTKQVSDNTLRLYNASIRAMTNWSQQKRVIDAESTVFVDPLVATIDMLSREDLSPRVKLNYRSALLWYLDQKSKLTERDIQARKVLFDKDALPIKDKRKQGLVVPEKELNKILSHLELKAKTESNEIAAMTMIWIKAGLATGLRPVEWLDATWASKENKMLQTISAKTKIGKIAYLKKPHDGLGCQAMQPMQLRQISLLADDDIQVVEEMLGLIARRVPGHLTRAKKQVAFNKLYLAVKQRIYTACKEIYRGKRNYSLYAFRRQFSANAKAAVGSDITAEMMGHFSSQSPSTGYYGKANQAHSRYKVTVEQRRMEEASAASNKGVQKMQVTSR